MCPLEHLIRPYNLTEVQNASVDINGQRSHNVVSRPVITAPGWGLGRGEQKWVQWAGGSQQVLL